MLVKRSFAGLSIALVCAVTASELRLERQDFSTSRSIDVITSILLIDYSLCTPYSWLSAGFDQLEAGIVKLLCMGGSVCTLCSQVSADVISWT